MRAAAEYDDRRVGKTKWSMWMNFHISHEVAEFLRSSWVKRMQTMPPEVEDNLIDDRAADATESQEHWDYLISLVSERQAALLSLVYRDGLTINEASKALGMKPATGRKSHTRAIERLRRALVAA